MVGEPSHPPSSAQGQVRRRDFCAACSAISGQRNHTPTQIGPVVPYPRWGLIVDCEVRAEAAPCAAWDRPVILPMARSIIPAISHDLLDLRSMGNSHIPQRPVVVFRQRDDSPFISRSRRHFAHRLAMARQIMDSQPGWTNRYRSTSPAGYRDRLSWMASGVPNAVRSIASSRSSTVISARAGGRNRRNGFPSFAPGEFLAAAEHQPRR